MTILINKKITHEFVTELMNTVQKDNDNTLRAVFFNCPGGDVAAGLALMDYCRWKYQRIDTMAFGVVSSLAAMMFSCWQDFKPEQEDDFDTKGRPKLAGTRCIAKNAVLMFHPLVAVTSGDDHFRVIMDDRYKKEFRAKRIDPDLASRAKNGGDFYVDSTAAMHTWGLADYIL